MLREKNGQDLVTEEIGLRWLSRGTKMVLRLLEDAAE